MLAQPAGKASFLLHTWGQQALTVRANGFSPTSEAIGDGATRMKKLAEALPKLAAQARILGLCERGDMNFDKLEEPHASIAQRLSKTKVRAAISAGQGSAIAFVSEWDDHVSIDHCVVNPSYMGLGEGAEAALLEYVATGALEQGAAEVRLSPMYQIEGDAFYERCGFYADEGDDATSNERTLRFRPADCEAAPAAAADTSGASSSAKAEEPLGAAPPAGFEWGVTL